MTAGVECAAAFDDVETFVLGVSVGHGTGTCARRDDLVEEGECVVGLNARGHDLPEVADLPVGGGVMAVLNERFGDARHDEESRDDRLG